MDTRDNAARRVRAAEERLAAIPGALTDYALSSDFRRAQELLCERVKAYGMEIDGALLTVLAGFGEVACRVQQSGACDAAASAALTAALDAYVIACRLAAFDRTLDRPGDEATLAKSPGTCGPLPPGIEVGRSELVSRLDRLQRDLLQEAEGQEWCDANNNAAAFRAAAGQVALARGLLAYGPAE